MGQSVDPPAGDAAGPGGAFNLRILSDSVPDFSSRETFAASALSHLQSEHERAIAQWRWMHRLRRVGNYAAEDGRPVLDPVLFFNSYGVTFCSMISQMNCSIWEARGLASRTIDLPGHVVSEVHYDDAWHMLDNDFCNYFLNEKGAIASAAELVAGRVRQPGQFYIYDHCPAASCPGGRVFMGPSSARLADVAGEWYKWARPRKGYTGSHAGQRYILGLLPGQSYTRYWRPLGTGERFARLFSNGKDPAEDGGQVLRNSRANGRWHWAFNMLCDSPFASENTERGERGIGAGDKSRPGHFVLRLSAANVLTSADIHVGPDPARVFVSPNHGVSWIPVATKANDRAGISGSVAAEIAGRLELLVKIQVEGQAVVSEVEIEAVTQLNPRVLPALRLGTNSIVAVSDGHYETVTFNPRLTCQQAAGEVFSIEGFQGINKPTDSQPSLHSTGGDASLVLRATVPRPITGLRMASTLHQAEPSGEFFMHSSFDGGANWAQLRHELFAGWPADHRYQVRQYKVPENVREARLRYSFDAAGCGLVNVFAEVNYQPAGPFMPYDLTYSWAEYRDGKWTSRTHTERIGSPYHKYTINVAGTRPPRMEWVRISAAPTDEHAATKPGYSDGGAAGDASPAREGYRLVRGNNIARGCKYEVSRPASDAFPDTDGKLLTDGMLLVSSFWGLADINLAGKKNERQVGTLAVWPAGDELLVTIDLGRSQKIAGARICALQPNENVLYPARMTVETSVDGKTFAGCGSVGWEECFFPPADEVQWEGTDSPIYDHLPAGGILDYKFAVVFKQSADARYVRFRFAPPADAKAGIALWELEVYDRLSREPFEDTITLPAKPE